MAYFAGVIVNKIAKQILEAIKKIARPAWWDPSQNRLRETAIIESGTVTTVTTVTGLNGFNTWQSQMLIQCGNRSSWASCVRNTIT